MKLETGHRCDRKLDS